MDFNALIGPAVVAAAVSGIVTIIGNSLSNKSSRAINLEKIASEKDLAERKFEAETDLAERKFKQEQALHDYRRTVEFGEDLLSSFYKLKDVVRAVRGPFSYGDEGATRKRRPNEIEAEAQSRDGFYVPIARLQKETTFISDLLSKKYRAQAVFGNDVHRAFEMTVEVLNKIQIASNMLVENVGQGRQEPEFWRGLERDIWDTSGPDKPDALAQKILDAIGLVEKAVRPALEGAKKENDLAGHGKKVHDERPTGYRKRSKSSHSSFASMG